MKHIKLFEQFDEWDPFGEESKPYDGKLRIFKDIRGDYYLMEKFSKNGNVFIYNNCLTGWNYYNMTRDCKFISLSEISENNSIRIYYGNFNLNLTKIKDLPQEIKDRIV